jgi:hypothetical protein
MTSINGDYCTMEFLFKIYFGICETCAQFDNNLKRKKSGTEVTKFGSLGMNWNECGRNPDRLCGLVVRVLGYRSGGPGSIPGTTRKKKE